MVFKYFFAIIKNTRRTQEKKIKILKFMKIFQNFFNKLNEYVYRNTCQTLFNSYKKIKRNNPNVSEKELCMMTLSLRPTYRQDSINKNVFMKGVRTITIKEDEGIRDLIINVIMTEHSPGFANPREDIDLMVKVLLIVDEELETYN